MIGRFTRMCTCDCRLEGLLPPAVEPIELQAERCARALWHVDEGVQCMWENCTYPPFCP